MQLWLFRALFLASFAGTAFAWTPVGDVVSQSYGTNGIEFTLSSGAIARIEIIDRSIARVRVNPSGTISPRISPSIASGGLLSGLVRISETNGVLWLSGEQIKLSVQKTPFQVAAWYADGAAMVADTTNAVIWDETTGKIIASKTTSAGEHFFGLGMFGGPIDRTGRTYVMRNTDNSGYGEFTQPLYQSYPFYYGIHDGRTYGLFLDNPAFPFFDMNSDAQGRVLFGAEMGELNYYLIAGPEPSDVASAYARLTGSNPLPPKWSLGYHHSHYGWNSEQQITNIAAQLRAQDFPCDTLWFDIDYMDQFHHFTWNPTNFPDPAGMHARLGEMGFHRVVINEPCLLQTDPLWSFMDASKYFTTNSAGQSLVDSIWFGDVSFIDYSNSEARDWYKEQLKTFLSLGISGLWLDLNEPANNFMPDAIYAFDGDPRTDLEARNIYALIEAKMAYEAQVESRTNTRPWNFSRSGHAGIQRYSHTWSGDAPSTFDSLRVSVQMSISMGLSGQNQFGHDTGGFLGSPSGELFTRWLEFSCFTPLFRNHSMNTSEPREPWSFGEPYTSTIRSIIKQRYEFLPYTYTLFEEASRTGRPVLAPVMFYAAGDQTAYGEDSEYLFGPNLLVAPVFTEGATNRSVYLPVGSDWVNFWTDETFTGGQRVTVSAPLGVTPLFVRNGGILIRGSSRNYVDAPADPAMRLDVYPSADSSFTLYEDDGKSFDYRNGAYRRTEIKSHWAQNAGTLSISRVSGDYQIPSRPWNLVLHGISKSPGQLRLNGNVIRPVLDQAELDFSTEGWFYDTSAHLVRARVQESGAALAIEILSQSNLEIAPAQLTALQGGDYSLAAILDGTNTSSIQWFNGTNALAGQTNLQLTLTNIQAINSGDYSFVLENSGILNISKPASVRVILNGLAIQLGISNTAKLTLEANSDAGLTIQYKTNLLDSPWLNWTNIQPSTGTHFFQFTEPVPESVPERFYRVVAPIQEQL